MPDKAPNLAHWADVREKHMLLSDFMDFLSARGVLLTFPTNDGHLLDDEKPARLADIFLEVDRIALEAERRELLENAQRNVNQAVLELPPRPTGAAEAVAKSVELSRQAQNPEPVSYHGVRDSTGIVRMMSAMDQLRAAEDEKAWAAILEGADAPQVDMDLQIAVLHVVDCCRTGICLKCGSQGSMKVTGYRGYYCEFCEFGVSPETITAAVAYCKDLRERLLRDWDRWLKTPAPIPKP